MKHRLVPVLPLVVVALAAPAIGAPSHRCHGTDRTGDATDGRVDLTAVRVVSSHDELYAVFTLSGLNNGDVSTLVTDQFAATYTASFTMPHWDGRRIDLVVRGSEDDYTGFLYVDRGHVDADLPVLSDRRRGVLRVEVPLPVVRTIGGKPGTPPKSATASTWMGTAGVYDYTHAKDEARVPC